MDLKKLIQGAVDLLGATYTYNEAKEVYTIELIFEGSTDEVVHVYQDLFEDDDEDISKKVLVCESYVTEYDSSKDLLFLSESNDDLFFSRAYVSEESKKIIIESCNFLENLTDLQLSIIINEIAQHSNFLKEEL